MLSEALDSQEYDVESLLADVEAGVDPNAAPAEDPAKVEAAAPAEIQEMEFTWNGKPIKAPVDRFKQWASQGYDYSQKMQEFKTQQAAFEKSQKEFEPLKSRYSEIDEYAKQNPQWLEQVNQSYLQAIGKAQADGAPNHEIQS